MSHIDQLVARQIEFCELRRRLEEEIHSGRRPVPSPPSPGPCLVVSRERGSGGTQIARLVGERLGWHVFDREIVDEIARRAQVRQQLVESVDERVRSRWSLVLGKPSNGATLDWHDYLYHLREVVLALGHHGHAVLVGRGAQWILPREGSLRVRVIAPIEIRARRLAERQGRNPNDARRDVEDTDRQRMAFLRRAFGHDPSAPHWYDLVLNTGDLDINAAAAIVLAALKEKLHVQAEVFPCVL